MSESAEPAPVLELDGVRKSFRGARSGRRRNSVVHAVDDVSFSVPAGHTAALVGESGSGKSTLARIVSHLIRPDSGRVTLLGTDVGRMNDSRFRPYRRHVQMVFQNPAGSFDPLRTIRSSIRETARLRAENGDVDAHIDDLLVEVGLSARFGDLKPALISGGEQQRAAIARALAARPELVVMDEPTSALDMSIQGQVLSLMRDLQRHHNLSYLVATHDLRAVRLMAHSVIVLYLGQIVEQGPLEKVFNRPAHPYTRGLLYAHDLAERTPERDRTVRLSATPGRSEQGYDGCRLVGRCPLQEARCSTPQALRQVSHDHLARCWRAEEGIDPTT